MERLTTKKDVSEMGMFELAHNSCYAKDGKARYRDYDLDIDARELTKKLLKDHAGDDDSFTDDEDFDDWMIDYLQSGMDSIEGLIALFYRNLWAMADLRERLAEYEDLEEQNRLIKLPCAVGDTAWIVFEGEIFKCMVSKFDIVRNGIFPMLRINETLETISVSMKTLEKTWFLTREEAESALEAERKGGDA